MKKILERYIDVKKVSTTIGMVILGTLIIVIGLQTYVNYQNRTLAGKQAELFLSGMIADSLNAESATKEDTKGKYVQTGAQISSELGSGKGESTEIVDPNATDVCLGAKHSDFSCYDELFKNLTNEKGTAASFGLLRKIYPINDYVRSQCHPITHVIGRTAALLYPTAAEAYKYGDSYCWSGYYHGVLETMVFKIGYENLSKSLNDICAPLEQARKYSFDHFNCVHGLGHGVMAVYGDDLFESLKACDALTDWWNRSSCWGGVFMENVIVDNTYHNSRFLKPEDPHYPCNAVGDAYKQTCYLMQTSYMLKVNNQDFDKVFALCSQTEDAYKNTCYQSLGRDASGGSLSEVAPTVAKCSYGDDTNQISNCIIGASKDFVSYFHGTSEAREFCKAWADPKLREVCDSTVTAYAQVL